MAIMRASHVVRREQGDLVSAELEEMVTRDATREASQVGQRLGEGRRL
jgi:hypothetical protein